MKISYWKSNSNWFKFYNVLRILKGDISTIELYLMHNVSYCLKYLTENTILIDLNFAMFQGHSKEIYPQ